LPSKYHKKQITAFTSHGKEYLHALVNEVFVSEAFDHRIATTPAPQRIQYIALWDTGSTTTLITNRVATALNLQPSGRTKVIGIHGPEEMDTYFIKLFLPNHVSFVGIRVAEGKIYGADVLTRNKLGEKMTRKQLAEAQRLAREWKPKQN